MKKLFVVFLLSFIYTVAYSQLLNPISFYSGEESAIVKNNTVEFLDEYGTKYICESDSSGLVTTFYFEVTLRKKKLEKELNLHRYLGNGVWETSQLRNGIPLTIYIEKVKIDGKLYLKNYLKKDKRQ